MDTFSEYLHTATQKPMTLRHPPNQAWVPSARFIGSVPDCCGATAVLGHRHRHGARSAQPAAVEINRLVREGKDIGVASRKPHGQPGGEGQFSLALGKTCSSHFNFPITEISTQLSLKQM